MRRAKPQPERPIETERLLLRPIRRDDLDDLVAEINDFDVARMTARIPHPYRMADARAYLAEVERPTAQAVSLTIAHGGRLIGGVSLFGLRYRPELGYWLGRRHWGNGFASEAAAALLAYGFDTLRLPLVHCRVAYDNPASDRVRRKLGFRRIGSSSGRSLARGAEVAHIHAVLTRARFRDMSR